VFSTTEAVRHAMSAVGAIETMEVHFGNGAVVRSGKTTRAQTHVLRRNRVDAEEYCYR
jgi:hypothetical protein